MKEPFEIADDVVVRVGGYDFHSTQASYTFGSQRRLSGNLVFERGTFYGGTKTTFARRKASAPTRASHSTGISIVLAGSESLYTDTVSAQPNFFAARLARTDNGGMGRA